MRPALLALALLAATSASPAAAQDARSSTPAAPRAPRSADELAAILSGFESAPESSEWRAMGTAIVSLLRAVATDTERPGYVRLRAVSAMGEFATSEVRTTLRRLLRDREPLLVREAARSMGRAFGPAALDDLAPLLAHDDSAVREAVVDALGRMGTADARARLRSRLTLERDVVLRERIQRRISGGVGSSPG